MSILAQVNLGLALAAEEHAEQLAGYQDALSQLARQAYVHKRPAVIVFEGWEAAGQGNVIKRLTETLDPRGYVVYSGAPPEGDDRTHHYLYRFWRRLPERGLIAVFDGSWYNRVLAGRAEHLCPEAEWRRAYREIDQFERQLVDFGTIAVKFWMHISLDEQLRRLRKHQESPRTAAELAAGDSQNQEKRTLYEAAVEEMLLKTSTLSAPWTIVEAEDESWAQIKVLHTVVEAFSEALGVTPGSSATGSIQESREKTEGTVEVEKRGKAKARMEKPDQQA
jgi:polyphosphate kinase 2 (PPK2 family)